MRFTDEDFNPNCYQRLGVPKMASKGEIRRAFAEKSKRYHPDKNGGNRSQEHALTAIIRAHQILTSARKKYDRELKKRAKNIKPYPWPESFSRKKKGEEEFEPHPLSRRKKDDGFQPFKFF